MCEPFQIIRRIHEFVKNKYSYYLPGIPIYYFSPSAGRFTMIIHTVCVNYIGITVLKIIILPKKKKEESIEL